MGVFHTIAMSFILFFLNQELDKENLVKILKVISLFPRMVNEETNEELYSPVKKEELTAILHSFKKDKSPRPDRVDGGVFY
jgi:hypothetical protein